MLWFDEYKKLLQDERDYYKEFIYDDDQRKIALDYDRFIESLKDIANNPDELKHMNRRINFAEEIALLFVDETLFISHILYNMKLIDNDIIELINQIDENFNEIAKDNKNDWSIDYMIKNAMWVNIRNIANKILIMLNEADDIV